MDAWERMFRNLQWCLRSLFKVSGWEHGESTPTLCSSGSSNGKYVLSCSHLVAFDHGAMPQFNPLLWDTCFWQVLGQVLLNQSLLYISLFFTGKKLLFVLFHALWVVWISEMNVKRGHVSRCIHGVSCSFFTLKNDSSNCPFCMLSDFSLLLFLLQVCV